MYDAIAPYYDLVHANLTEDIAYLVALAGETGSPVLELGCGSGRILFPLARAGHDVTGVDLSSAMLELAQNRLDQESTETQARVKLVQAHMESFELAQPPRLFATAIISYNTFMHLKPDNAALVLKRVGHQLRPNGRLFIDLVNPAHVARSPDVEGLTPERTLYDPGSGRRIEIRSSSRVDTAGQTLEVTWAFDAQAAGGRGQTRIVHASYTYYYPHQLDLLLTEAGLRIISLEGDYIGMPYDTESERLLVHAVAL
jgi:SAM-dependent methyltransferase